LQNAFYPTQKAILNFCEQYSAFTGSSAIAIELEYQYLNKTTITNETDFNFFYSQILKRNFNKSKHIFYKERNIPQILKYQIFLQNEKSLLINIGSEPKTLLNVKYFELVDYYLKYIKFLLEKDFRKIKYDILIFLQRNFPYLLNPSVIIFGEIKNSFESYRVEIENNLIVYMIIFIILMVTLKFFQMLQIVSLYHLINRLSSIFLRCNQQEAMREINFIEGFLSNFDKNEDFIYANFSEKCLAKKEQTTDLNLENSSIKTKTSVKPLAKKNIKNRNFFNSNITPLKKTKGFCFIFLTLILSFNFYFLNHLYWSKFNEIIKDVVSLDTSFISLHVYSATILLTNNLFLREMIIFNPSYEYLNDTYQKKAFRSSFFSASINKRIIIMTNIFNLEMPSRIIKAKTTVKDPYFEKLIENNLCQVLVEMGKIEEKELIICNKIWGGSFNKEER